MWKAEVIADSVSPAGHRLTTMQLCYPRIIHDQFLTHRAFSRNASSMRAVPVSKIIAEVLYHPFVPEEFGANQRGMTAHGRVSEGEKVQFLWRKALEDVLRSVNAIADLGVHKQLVNRLLTPWSWVRVVVSATDWQNFFTLRCAHDAQPEMQKLANMMLSAYDASVPYPVPAHGAHLPYITLAERDAYNLVEAQFTSAARCARVSYLHHGTGLADWTADVERGRKLADDKHLSPLEHPATALTAAVRVANYCGWRQLRQLCESHP